ncbi:triokinase/FMN cyclase [Culex quinquefasciatus]|uniref:triokinase/FMN cyclase n=1 Tax=Culex quinquefasciatus TaxID=7176 RepID=UPI0018E3E248|nr:triokinase/FMN cyclase [Culex quinquefasciatus]
MHVCFADYHYRLQPRPQHTDPPAHKMSLTSVGTSLSGLIAAHNGLQLLTPGCNSVTRLDNDPSDGKVKLLSGGGSGHEPAHAGYVGAGMLSGAICGDIFSSPSVASILDCLRTVAVGRDDARVIFIVKNYTGDRLNFGLAVERARVGLGYGDDVRMLLVDDDCSIERGQVRASVGKRGLAGVVLVHKILGAMAEDGVGLDEVYGFGEGLVRNLGTIGFTFRAVGDRLENVEIGKGIHGEPGVYTMPACGDFEGIVEFLLKKLEKCVPKAAEVVLMVNNLGGTSEFLMGIFLKSLLDKAKQSYTVKRTYCGSFLSSLDQAGISVTLLNLGYSPKLLQYLDYEVSVPSMLFGRKRCNLPPSAVATVSPMEVLQPTAGVPTCTITEQFGAKLASTVITFVCEALISCKDMLNTIDKEAGDGDTGSTISRGAQSVLDQLNAHKLDLTHPANLLQQISIILERDMGGSSGALYSLFFQGASKIFTEGGDQRVTLNLWSHALTAGNDTIAKYALTQLGDRTMLDALREGELAMKGALEGGKATLESVECFTKGCEEAARATQHMVARAGRASYAASSGEGDRKYQHPDPGAHAVSIWARALLEACKQVIVE